MMYKSKKLIACNDWMKGLQIRGKPDIVIILVGTKQI